MNLRFQSEQRSFGSFFLPLGKQREHHRLNVTNSLIKWTLCWLLINSSFANAQQLDTLVIKSSSMQKEIKNVVILPSVYFTSADNFPVLYLLHGAGDDYRAWVSKVPAIKELADTYQMIIVCPDGGYTSWYFDSAIDPAYQYETYITKELISQVDKQYKTKATRASRAITGLSMGGHGALYLAFRHPDIWGAAGSMSGGLNFIPFPNDWDIAKRLGDFSSHKKVWEKNTIINMLEQGKAASLALIIDCGTEDFFYEGNKSVHQKMIGLRIPHDYIERAGNHDWKYWSNAITYHVVFFNNYFKSKTM